MESNASGAAVRASDDATCLHCGTAFLARRGESFCCRGCEAVYNLLSKEGLQDFYRLRATSADVCPLPVLPSNETFEFCDDPAFSKARGSGPDGQRMTFFLEGLSCAACLWLLEKLPQICSACEAAQVNMSAQTIDVVRAPTGTFAEIARRLNSLGYRPQPIRSEAALSQLQRRQTRFDIARVGLAGACAGNIMILAVSIYAGATGTLANEFRWLSAAFAMPALTFCSWPFYRSAWGAIANRRLNIDVPIVAALLAGIAMSAIGLATGRETLYFDSLSTLVFLLLSTRLWLKGTQRRLLDVAHIEDELLLSSVWRQTPLGERERVSSLSLRAGDKIAFSEGAVEIVPADGEVLEGEGLIDRSVLTGESDPIAVGPGQRVEAGSRAINGSWLLRVDRPPRETRLAEILRDSEISAQAKSSLVVFADRVAQIFIALTLGAAALIAIGFVIAGNGSEGFARALTLTIVTCPCVFGMAIPLSASLAIRALARSGAVVKNPDALERMAKARTIYFDKTGTLTVGKMQVLGIVAAPGLSPEQRFRHLAAARALEAGQTHPAAKAIVAFLERELGPESDRLPENGSPREGDSLGGARAVRQLPEGGIEGEVLGSRYAIRPLGLVGQPAADTATVRARYGLDCDGARVADFEIGDEIRVGARATLGFLRARGLRLRLLSGDRDSIVRACALELGFAASEIEGEATPESKARIMRESGRASIMVGDGANDAAALAAAGVGVAVRGSLESSLRAADIYLTRSGLDGLPAVWLAARMTRSAVFRGLAFSGSFNLASGALAIAGHMSPLGAAVLMPLSSLVVLASALLTGRAIARIK